jgi:hypothetical protein
MLSTPCSEFMWRRLSIRALAAWARSLCCMLIGQIVSDFGLHACKATLESDFVHRL